MRDDTELKRIGDLSQPYHWDTTEKRITGIAVVIVALCILGLWKLVSLI